MDNDEEKECCGDGACSDGCVCLPAMPCEPAPEDCCGSGCSPCVYDLYEQEVRIWRAECARTHAAKQQPTQQIAVCEMSSDEYVSCAVSEMEHVSRDTQRYRFQLPQHCRLRMRPGQHLVTRWLSGGQSVCRQYTPVSPVTEHTYFDVIIKVYEQGVMSQYIRRWSVGDTVQWRGPFGDFTYQANSHARLVLLAAGTGVAPMVRVISAVLDNHADDSRVHLVLCCRRYRDILLKTRLDAWTSHWNFTVTYMLSQDDASGCEGKRYHDDIQFGRLTQDTLNAIIDGDVTNTLVLVCGTKAFDKDMINYLANIGIPQSNCIKF